MPLTDSNARFLGGNGLSPSSPAGSAILAGSHADSEGDANERPVLSPVPSTPCELHPGWRNTRGYGVVCKGRGWPQVVAHKYAWQKINGPVPEGFELHHRCENRPCIRLDHLQLVTDYQHRLIHGMYTKDDLIAAMWGFEAKYGRQPETSDWDATKARANGKPERAERYYRDGWPHASTAVARFGSWGKALEAAGFTPRRTVRPDDGLAVAS